MIDHPIWQATLAQPFADINRQLLAGPGEGPAKSYDETCKQDPTNTYACTEAAKETVKNQPVLASQPSLAALRQPPLQQHSLQQQPLQQHSLQQHNPLLCTWTAKPPEIVARPPGILARLDVAEPVARATGGLLATCAIAL